MYLILNETKYSNVDMIRNIPTEVIYTGSELTGIEAVSGTVSVYANNDFLLCEDDVSDYSRTVISDGRIALTNRPEPQPAPPEPEPPEDDVWSEIARAIRSGVNSVD